jgi:hypothetical protein
MRRRAAQYTIANAAAAFALIVAFCTRPAVAGDLQTSLPAMNFDASFGAAVAIRGDRVVVGAPSSGGGVGAAVVFRFDGSKWVHEQTLTPVGPNVGLPRDFGAAVAIHDQWIVIGAQRSADQGTNGGSAFVYRFEGKSWVQHQKLLPVDVALGDQFGNAVAVDGETILIAACGDNAPAPDSGSAYVYLFDGANWIQSKKLIADDAAAGDFFGRSLTMDGDDAIIGADGDDDIASAAGSAYVFHHDGATWVQEQKLHAPDGQALDSFGWSTSISNDAILIGAFRDDDNGTSSGSAHVFRHHESSWTHEQKLMPKDAAANDLFGISVSIAGDHAIIGASLDDDLGIDSGSAYCYRFDGATWKPNAKITAADGSEFNGFGYSVALWGDAMIAGSWNDADSGSNTGAAHVITNITGDCNANSISDYCDVIAGVSGDLNSDGLPDECDIPPPSCVADIAPEGSPNAIVDVDDLLSVIVSWGACGAKDCFADLTQDGTVGVDDLLTVINGWGPCE